MNSHYKRNLLLLVIPFAAASAFMFQLFYKEAEKIAISKLHEEQTIHAKQAARGIEEFFTTWTRNLGALARMDEVVSNDAVGPRSLKFFYESNKQFVTSIGRVNEHGIITYNYPDSRTQGIDISGQSHVRELLRERKPVISDVFRAVEGFDAVAVYAPAFSGEEFKGGVVVLINFESLAHHYVEVIRVGETGYAWMLSRDGTILYTPVPGLSGKSVSEATRNLPPLKRMVDRMLAGEEGNTTYIYDRIGDQQVAATRKYATYLPVWIGNTFWSIAVASAEQDVLSGLISFRNKLMWMVGVFFVGGMAFSVLGAKAWFIVSEEEKRLKVEAQLRDSERRFRQVAEATGDIIWEVDARGLYTFVSASVEKSLGYTPEELVGKMHFHDLFAPSVREELKAAAFRVFADRKVFLNFPNPKISKSGEIIYLETSGTPVLEEDGTLLGYCGADTDVTSRKKAEQEIVRQRDEVAHLSRVTTLGEISGSLAHELNQPLGAILANAEAAAIHLKSDTPDLVELREILAEIRRDDMRAGEIIHGIRDFLRRRSLALEPLEVRELVAEAVRFVSADASQRKISIGLEIPTDLPPVMGDRVHIQQVLVNLLVNGMDAVSTCPVSSRRMILRAAESAPDHVEFAVSDAGIGIPPASLERVFDPFHTSKPGGLGLGLAICRSIIEAHGGSISIENNPDRGATVRFSLRIQQQSAVP